MGEPIVETSVAAPALAPLHVSGGPSPDELAAALAVLAARRLPDEGSRDGVGLAVEGYAAAWRALRRNAIVDRGQRLGAGIAGPDDCWGRAPFEA